MKNSTKLGQEPEVPVGSVTKANEAGKGKHESAEKQRCRWRRNPVRALKDSEALYRCRRGARLKAAHAYGAVVEPAKHCRGHGSVRVSDPVQLNHSLA